MDYVNPATALTAAEPAVMTPAPLAGPGERSDEICYHSDDNRASVSIMILRYVSTTLANGATIYLKRHVVCGYSLAVLIAGTLAMGIRIQELFKVMKNSHALADCLFLLVYIH